MKIWLYVDSNDYDLVEELLLNCLRTLLEVPVSENDYETSKHFYSDDSSLAADIFTEIEEEEDLQNWRQQKKDALIAEIETEWEKLQEN